MPRPTHRPWPSFTRFIHSFGVLGLFSLAILAAYIFFATFGNWLVPHAPNATDPTQALLSPSAEHFFGTDALGRDIFSRVIDATRIALIASGGPVAIAFTIGLVVGGVSGYLGGIGDLILVRVMDVLFSFPALLLAIVIVAALGSGVTNAVLAIAIVYIPRFARLARSSTLSLREEQYIEAARLAGIGHARILLRHIAPNVMPTLIVLAGLSMATAQLAYASLSFLGLGTSPPQADLGSMIAESRDFMTFAPWLTVFPTGALVLLVVILNLLGDALRDYVQPGSQRSGSLTAEKLGV